MLKKITASLDRNPGGFSLEILSSNQSDPVTAEELELLIRALARVRESLNPPVQMEVPALEGIQAVGDDPSWFGAYDEVNDRVALVLRHPGYAWVGYALSPPSAEQLIGCLKRICDQRDVRHRNLH